MSGEVGGGEAPLGEEPLRGCCPPAGGAEGGEHLGGDGRLQEPRGGIERVEGQGGGAGLGGGAEVALPVERRLRAGEELEVVDPRQALEEMVGGVDREVEQLVVRGEAEVLPAARLGLEGALAERRA